MGKTVKEAYDILHSDEFLQVFNDNTPPTASAGKDYTDKTLLSLLDLFYFFMFEKVFPSVWAHQNFWNCRHHGINCDYVLTEKDLTD